MNILQRIRRLSIQYVAGIIGLLGLPGCTMGKLAADDYFSGDYLVAAQAINAGDMKKLREVGQRLPDLDAPGRKEITLLWFAFNNARFEAIQTLVELGSDPTGQVVQGLGSPLMAALRHKDIRYLQTLLAAGADPHYTSPGGTPLICEAAGPAGYSLEHVKLLLDYGADINARSTQLWIPPLMQAIDTERTDVAMYLVEHGADVNAFDRIGVTMLWAVESSIEMLQPGTGLRLEYERLRQRMIEKGAKYPPDPPKQVRAWGRAQGLDMVQMADD